jgi:hypothetical protein
MKNKKISPYVKLRRNLFNSNETAELMAEEGATGAGAFVLIMMYLAGCEDTVGSLHCLPVLAAKCHKSKAFVLHIIRDYGLFTVVGNCFYSASLCENLNIELSIDSDDSADNYPYTGSDGPTTHTGPVTHAGRVAPAYHDAHVTPAYHDAHAAPADRNAPTCHVAHAGNDEGCTARNGHCRQHSASRRNASGNDSETIRNSITSHITYARTRTDVDHNHNHYHNHQRNVIVDNIPKDIADASAPTTTTAAADIVMEEIKPVVSAVIGDRQTAHYIASVYRTDFDGNRAHYAHAVELWAKTSADNGLITPGSDISFHRAKTLFTRWMGVRQYRGWEESLWRERDMKTTCSPEIVDVPDYAKDYVS